MLSDSLFYKLYPLKTNTDSTQVVPFTQPIANGLIVVVITVNLLHHCLCGIFGKKNFFPRDSAKDRLSCKGCLCFSIVFLSLKPSLIIVLMVPNTYLFPESATYRLACCLFLSIAFFHVELVSFRYLYSENGINLTFHVSKPSCANQRCLIASAVRVCMILC